MSSISPLNAVSKSNSHLINRLREKLRNRRVIVCIDHFEHITQMDIVDKLLNLGVNIILVSNDKNCFEKLSTTAKSMIVNVLKIPKYDFEQVKEIILERAKLALKPNSYDERVISEISRKCDGNVALGISLLRTAISVAESENRDVVKREDIPNDSVENSKLSDDEATLLSILREHGRLHASKLYSLYCEKAKNPKGERSFRKYMGKLVARGFVRAMDVRRWRIYEIKGDSIAQG